MMHEFFSNLESGLSKAIGAGEASPRKIYARELARLGTRLYGGNGGVAWCGITAPFDLLNAMGVTSCFVEFVGAMLASTGVVGSFIEETDHMGYSSDACSYHRAVMGASRKGMVPEPAFLVGTTNPCSGGLAVIENLARRFGKRQYVLHIPQDQSGGNVRFLAEQLRDLSAFVAAHTGAPLDPDALRRAVSNTNEARALMAEAYEFAKAVPSPVATKDLANYGIVMALFLGTDAAVDIARAFRDEFAKRVADTRSGVPNEKVRLLWIQNRIQFKNGIDDILAREYDASVVIDELNDITWDAIDPDEPFEGIARRSISIPFNGSIANRVAHLKKLAREYRVHGAVNPCNWGCRQGTGARGLIEEGLKEIGVPVLNLEVDCIDSRKFTEGQFRTRIEAFMEMLAGRPSPWS
ncbi:MAG TPA: 2-hydroxyacyl-CoA dehydratase family protein [Spirochaetota bacterium]|nr:2-hydroxyacyl-CoA dehydratase family protein [Spirochaetota bacterium]HNT12777.1 2-hydroxyacyl-CoA dehydratase family protein [Spirochaetota bacterium]